MTREISAGKEEKLVHSDREEVFPIRHDRRREKREKEGRLPSQAGWENEISDPSQRGEMRYTVVSEKSSTRC